MKNYNNKSSNYKQLAQQNQVEIIKKKSKNEENKEQFLNQIRALQEQLIAKSSQENTQKNVNENSSELNEDHLKKIEELQLNFEKKSEEAKIANENTEKLKSELENTKQNLEHEKKALLDQFDLKTVLYFLHLIYSILPIFYSIFHFLRIILVSLHLLCLLAPIIRFFRSILFLIFRFLLDYFHLILLGQLFVVA